MLKAAAMNGFLGPRRSRNQRKSCFSGWLDEKKVVLEAIF